MASNIKLDRFGNEFQLIGCKDKKGNGFGAGYFEMKGQLYKVEASEAQKEGYTHWVKITKVKKTPKSSSW